MKILRYLLLPLFLILSSGTAQQTIPAFPIQSSDIELTQLAQPDTYFDKVGRKFAVLGTESGSFEAWAYPLKLFRNFQLSFFLGTSTSPILARDIVRRVNVSPAATVLTYTYQSFTLRAIFITPIDEPGAYMLLELDSNEPLSIVCSFIPVLQPMWPAGLGGQSAYWMDNLHAYRISEPTRKNTAFVGSPAAAGMSYTPAHMLSDKPNEFRITIDHPDSVRGRYIPIVMAGGHGDRDSIQAIYQRLLKEPEEQYQRVVQHYADLRSSTLQVHTPVDGINLAYEWSKIAYDNLFVDNPDLGLGMVAGLGASGTSGRPGFGWFFGGDAFINSFSLISYGAYGSVRDALRFTEKWQRDDGKMAHELSQAAGYIDWWKDYPYGFIHGDTSPYYICAVWDYFRSTGDTAFVRASWPHIQKAYDWSLATDVDGDGLMDNKKAGLGALEYGPLTDIQSDIYTSAIWVRATAAMPTLCLATDHGAFAQISAEYHAKALRSFNERFWDEKRQQYAYAFTPKGQRVDIVSPWSCVGLMWEIGDPVRSIKSLLKLNSSELSTDWGIRSISNKSSYYEPLNYNYGAVWPFLSSWVATAQFKHHLSLQGYNTFLASVGHTFDNGLGYITEVFSGDRNIWPQEAVAHQGFSTASVDLPLIRGLLGLEGTAYKNSFEFSPHLPADWAGVTVGNYRLGDAVFSLEYQRTRTKVTLKVTTLNGAGTALTFAPALGVGTSIGKARIDGRETPYRMIVSSQTVQPLLDVTLGTQTVIEIELTPTVEILPPPPMAETGDRNTSMKILGMTRKDNDLVIVAEGRSGMAYDLGIMNEDLVASTRGCQLQGKNLHVIFPDGSDEFTRLEFAVTVK